MSDETLQMDPFSQQGICTPHSVSFPCEDIAETSQYKGAIFKQTILNVFSEHQDSSFVINNSVVS